MRDTVFCHTVLNNCFSQFDRDTPLKTNPFCQGQMGNAARNFSAVKMKEKVDPRTFLRYAGHKLKKVCSQIRWHS